MTHCHCASIVLPSLTLFHLCPGLHILQLPAVVLQAAAHEHISVAITQRQHTLKASYVEAVNKANSLMHAVAPHNRWASFVFAHSAAGHLQEAECRSC